MAYGSVADMGAYWAAHGYDADPLTPDAMSALLEAATRYIDGLGWRIEQAGHATPLYSGQPATQSQVNQWPRINATDVYGREIAPDVVPLAIQQAAYEAAFYAKNNSGGLNTSTRSDQDVVEETYDVISFRYAPKATTSQSGTGAIANPTIIPAVATLLAPYLTDAPSGAGNDGGEHHVTGLIA